MAAEREHDRTRHVIAKVAIGARLARAWAALPFERRRQDFERRIESVKLRAEDPMSEGGVDRARTRASLEKHLAQQARPFIFAEEFLSDQQINQLLEYLPLILDRRC